MFTKHQSRRRALILMTPTQHPCCSCSLTPFYAHTLVYMAYIHTHTKVSFALFFTSLPPLSSLLLPSPVPPTTVMIHVMNHSRIFEGFSPHASLLSPLLLLSISFTQSLSRHSVSVLLFFLFSKFQSTADRICLYSTSKRKRNQNIRGNVKQPHFSPLQLLYSVPAGCKITCALAK